MKPLTTAVVEAGILPENALKEMARFSPVISPRPAVTDQVPLEDAAATIQRAVQGEDYVAFRETDLDAVKTYLKTQKQGTLHLTTASAEGAVAADFPVAYGRTTMGEFLIPWNSPNIADAMTDPETYLITEEGEEVHFSDMRELHYDDMKAFMVCQVRA
jgi:hypothetical protein